MKIKEIEINIKAFADTSEPEIADNSENSTQLTPVEPVQKQPVKKKVAKRWQPPLQQMLDTVKAASPVVKQPASPSDPATKLAIAQQAADPSTPLGENVKRNKR